MVRGSLVTASSAVFGAAPEGMRLTESGGDSVSTLQVALGALAIGVLAVAARRPRQPRPQLRPRPVRRDR